MISATSKDTKVIGSMINASHVALTREASCNDTRETETRE